MFKGLTRWVDKQLLFGMLTADIPVHVTDFEIAYEYNPQSKQLEPKHNVEQVLNRIQWFFNCLKSEKRGAFVLLMGDLDNNKGHISFLKENENLTFSNIFNEMQLTRGIVTDKENIVKNMYEEIDKNKDEMVYRLLYIHDEDGLEFILKRLPNLRNREILKRYYLPFRQLLRFATGSASINTDEEMTKL